MDFAFFVPCQPDWLCVPFMSVFTLLLLVGLFLFGRMLFREYKKMQRAKKTRRLRRTHYRDRKGGRNGRPTNVK